MITRKQIQRGSLNFSLLQGGEEGSPCLVLLHGNISSSLFFWDLLERLSDFHCLAPDLRGFGQTERKPIDATLGFRNWSEDLHALLKDQESLHLLGWSLGGGIALQYLMDHPQQVASVCLVNPISPYGFSGTKDVEGTPNNPEYSGTGAALHNPALIDMLRRKHRQMDPMHSPRRTLKSYFAPGFKLDPEVEERLLDAMFEMALGDDYYPGDSETCMFWPYIGPGKRGINNATSPKYNGLKGLLELDLDVPILWVRGGRDLIVSDGSLADTGTLGKVGLIPAWPGQEEYPPQPMLDQTRWFLSLTGRLCEEVFEKSGHCPFIEEPDRFAALWTSFLREVMK